MENKTSIMLVCVAGMSTSLLVSKMRRLVDERELNVEVFANPVEEADEILAKKKVDAVLLGPQIRYLKDEFEQKLAKKNIPLGMISMNDYAMINSEEILNQALSLMAEDSKLKS